MGLLESLLGGGGQQRQEYEDFANRYEQGAPWDGISDDEAMSRYQQVAPHIPQDVYEQSAEQAYSRLSPQQRMQLGRHLQQQASQHGVDFPDMNQDGVDDRYQDPRQLARMSSRIEQQQPGLLGQLLGGGGGGGLPGLGGGGGGLGGGMLESPIARAALGGIAAMAVRNMMGGRR